MDVEINGVAINNGATLSTTGRMLVDCDVPYELSVNDIVWSPIGREDNKDLYLLTSGGRVVIKVNEMTLFTFLNVYERSFSPDYYFYHQDRGNTIVDQGYIRTEYVQKRFVDNTINAVTIRTYPNSINLEELVVTTNQGEIEYKTPVGEADANKSIVAITNVDASNYLAVYAGGDLIAFFLPAE